MSGDPDPGQPDDCGYVETLPGLLIPEWADGMCGNAGPYICEQQGIQCINISCLLSKTLNGQLRNTYVICTSHYIGPTYVPNLASQ